MAKAHWVAWTSLISLHLYPGSSLPMSVGITPLKAIPALSINPLGNRHLKPIEPISGSCFMRDNPAISHAGSTVMEFMQVTIMSLLEYRIPALKKVLPVFQWILEWI